MPYKELIMEIEFKMVFEEADASPCHACGDPIFCEGRKFILTRVCDGVRIGELDYKFCQSCGEAMNSMMTEEEERWK